MSLASTGCSAVAVSEPPGAEAPTQSGSYPLSPVGTNPLAGKPLYVDPATSAAVAAEQTSPRRAELVTLAETPQARWVTNDTAIDQVAAYVRDYVSAAARSDALPLLALYAIPKRDCGGYSAGGFATADEYQAWIAEIGRGIGTGPVAVVVEPDALTAADCLPPAEQQERRNLLRDAVQKLTENPNAAVYVDAGHSRWLTPEELAQRLRSVDVGRARGFALNTSNFLTTAEQVDYGEKVSALLDGAHYVIDTSRNGAGPAPDEPLNWCNPRGRALGSYPTTATGGAHADAYLWIKHPGESDGECGRGDPRSGLFTVPLALELVQNAKR